MDFFEWLKRYHMDKPGWRGQFLGASAASHFAPDITNSDDIDRMAWAWNAGVEAALATLHEKTLVGLGPFTSAIVRDVKNTFNQDGSVIKKGQI